MSTGSITTTGTGIALTVIETADVQLLATSSGSITFGGTTGTLTASGAGAPGTVTLNSASTVNFTGTGAQTIPVYTYGNLTKSGVGGTATLATGTIPIAGTLTVTTGTLQMADSVPTVTGATTVASGGTLAFNNATGLKTFTGNVTVNGIWNETAAVAVTYAGSLTNNLTYTASTGVHTFSGTAQTITGTVSIPNLTISGTTSNAGTLTVSTALAGASTLTNAANATLNIGGTSAPTLVATATGNTVNYTGAAQTVLTAGYYNLTLSGSGAKTIGSGLTVGYDIVIDTGVTAALTGATTAAGGLKLGGTWKSVSTWNSTNAATFLSGAGTITNTLSHTSSTTTTTGGGGTPTTTTVIPPAVPVVVPPVVIAGCEGRNTGFSTVSGKSCVGNTVTVNVIAGCTSSTAFSPLTGQSCGNNTSNTIIITPPAFTGPFSYAFGTVVVKRGSKGEACRAWQNFFNAQRNAGLATDGVCGPLTIASARAWQTSAGLVADGLLGPMSRAKANMQAGVSTN